MTKYELINPSDEIYFEAKNDKIAYTVATLMGRGFGAENTETKEIAVDFNPLGVPKPEFEENVDCEYDEWLESNKQEIIEGLKSMEYADERTSLYKIVDNAHSLAEEIEEKVEDK